MLRGPLRLSLRALTIALVLLITAVLGAAEVSQETNHEPSDEGSVAAEVRTGTTSVQAPEAPARAIGEAAESSESGHGAPRDAPRFGASVPSLPPAPPSHSTQSRGWIRFAYHPSVRAHVQPLIDQADAVRSELGARLG